VRELAGEAPTAVEVILAEAVALARLDAHDAAATYYRIMNDATVGLGHGDYDQRRLGRAQGRLLAACRALETCRRLALPAKRREAGEKAPAPTACPLSVKRAKTKRFGGRLAGVAAEGQN
jgi:hypothetical protein